MNTEIVNLLLTLLVEGDETVTIQRVGDDDPANDVMRIHWRQEGRTVSKELLCQPQHNLGLDAQLEATLHGMVEELDALTETSQ